MTAMLLADRWDQLPEAGRDEFLARRQAAGRWPYGAQEGWQRGRRWQPLRPLVFDAAGYARFGPIMARLLGLAVDACRRRAATAGELRAVMADPRSLRLLHPDQPLAHAELLRIARPDVLLCQGVPRLVELNIAIPLYGVPALDRMAAAYLRLWDREPLAATASVLTTRSALLATVAAGSRVLVPTWHSARGQAGKLGNRRALRAYLEPTVRDARAHGIDVIVEDLSQLRTDRNANLHARGRRVELVFNWFVSAAVTDDAGGLDAISRAQAAGTVRLFLPEAMRLLCSKQVLAWLHEDIDLLSPADRSLVATHVPWTVWAGPQQSPAERAQVVAMGVRERASLVLKPANGSSGRGVVFGAEVDEAEWAGLLAARSQAETVVLQRRVLPDPVAMSFFDPVSGRRANGRVPCVTAPFLVDGQICGALVRHFGPGPGGQVINTGAGAVVNTVVLSRPPPLARD